ncbi:hypothetical protein D3C80_1417270 [compost metagenome]
MPAPQLEHQPTGQRREHRRHAHHQGDQTHHPSGLLRRATVAHDGYRQDRPGAASQSLHEAPANQLGQAVAAGQQQRRQGIEGQTEQQRRLAPEAVADRPVAEHAEEHADEIGGKAQLHLAGCQLQRSLDRREGRQIHVGRHRGDGGQGAQQQQQHERYISRRSHGRSLFM